MSATLNLGQLVRSCPLQKGNFTFEELNDIISDGKNLGQLKLNGKGKLEKINNHATRTSKNNGSTTASENYSVRQAVYQSIYSKYRKQVQDEEAAEKDKNRGGKLGDNASPDRRFRDNLEVVRKTLLGKDTRTEYLSRKEVRVILKQFKALVKDKEADEQLKKDQSHEIAVNELKAKIQTVENAIRNGQDFAAALKKADEDWKSIEDGAKDPKRPGNRQVKDLSQPVERMAKASHLQNKMNAFLKNVPKENVREWETILTEMHSAFADQEIASLLDAANKTVSDEGMKVLEEKQKRHRDRLETDKGFSDYCTLRKGLREYNAMVLDVDLEAVKRDSKNSFSEFVNKQAKDDPQSVQKMKDWHIGLNELDKAMMDLTVAMQKQGGRNDKDAERLITLAQEKLTKVQERVKGFMSDPEFGEFCRLRQGVKDAWLMGVSQAEVDKKINDLRGKTVADLQKDLSDLKKQLKVRQKEAKKADDRILATTDRKYANESDVRVARHVAKGTSEFEREIAYQRSGENLAFMRDLERTYATDDEAGTRCKPILQKIKGLLLREDRKDLAKVPLQPNSPADDFSGQPIKQAFKDKVTTLLKAARNATRTAEELIVDLNQHVAAYGALQETGGSSDALEEKLGGLGSKVAGALMAGTVNLIKQNAEKIAEQFGRSFSKGVRLDSDKFKGEINDMVKRAVRDQIVQMLQSEISGIKSSPEIRAQLNADIQKVRNAAVTGTLSKFLNDLAKIFEEPAGDIPDAGNRIRSEIATAINRLGGSRQFQDEIDKSVGTCHYPVKAHDVSIMLVDYFNRRRGSGSNSVREAISRFHGKQQWDFNPWTDGIHLTFYLKYLLEGFATISASCTTLEESVQADMKAPKTEEEVASANRALDGVEEALRGVDGLYGGSQDDKGPLMRQFAERLEGLRSALDKIKIDITTLEDIKSRNAQNEKDKKALDQEAKKQEKMVQKELSSFLQSYASLQKDVRTEVRSMRTDIDEARTIIGAAALRSDVAPSIEAPVQDRVENLEENKELGTRSEGELLMERLWELCQSVNETNTFVLREMNLLLNPDLNGAINAPDDKVELTQAQNRLTEGILNAKDTTEKVKNWLPEAYASQEQLDDNGKKQWIKGQVDRFWDYYRESYGYNAEIGGQRIADKVEAFEKENDLRALEKMYGELKGKVADSVDQALLRFDGWIAAVKSPPVYVKQSIPANCCWLHSVLNALQSTPEGWRYYSELVKYDSKNQISSLTFYDNEMHSKTYERDGNHPNVNENNLSLPTYLEEMAMHHVLWYNLMPKGSNGADWNPGEFGSMEGVCKCLGLVPSPMSADRNTEFGKKNNNDERRNFLAAEIKRHLKQGEFVTFNTGRQHFISIIGIDDNQKVRYVDSNQGAGNAVEPSEMSLADLLKPWGSNVAGQGSCFYFLRLRSDCEKDVRTIEEMLTGINEVEGVAAHSLNGLKKEYLTFLRSPDGLQEVAAWRNGTGEDEEPFTQDAVLAAFVKWNEEKHPKG